VKEAFKKLESETKNVKDALTEESENQAKQFEEKRRRKRSCEKRKLLINLAEKSKKYLKRKGAQFDIIKNYC
jgi:hypothetical protein